MRDIVKELNKIAKSLNKKYKSKTRGRPRENPDMAKLEETNSKGKWQDNETGIKKPKRYDSRHKRDLTKGTSDAEPTEPKEPTSY